MKKILITLIICAVALSTTAFAADWSDIPMKYMSDNGYFQTANPDALVTRLDVAKVLGKLPLIDKGSHYIFTDTSDTDVIKVAKSGLMNGYGNQTFKPDGNITREELAKVFSYLLSSAQSAADSPFDDTGEIGAWAYPYVSALVKEGIILGYEDNTFRPKNNITHAELAVMFMRIRDRYTISDITGNVFNNAAVTPLRFLEIPNGFVGVLSIPSLGLTNLPVAEDGENLDNIKNVAGHFINTALFDGNVGILGHNFNDKSPWFGKLDSINEGARITWKTKFGIRHYTVTTRKTIAADDWSSLIETGDNRITLITCLAGQAQTQRILVQAVETQ